MMLIYWLCYLLSVNVYVDAGQEYTICSKCASNYIVYQWENIHLNRNMRALAEIAGDDNCVNMTGKIPTVRCQEQCALFSVFANRNGHEYVFGTYRDCSTAGSFNELMKEIKPDSSKLEIDLSSIRGFQRKVVFELCDGSNCNGNQEQQQLVIRSSSSRLQKNTAHASLPNFLLLISILFLCLI